VGLKRKFGAGLTARLLLASGVTLALVVVVFVLMLNAISQLEDSNDTASRANSRLALAGSLRGAATDIETGVRDFLLTDNPSFLAPRTQALRAIPKLEAEVEAAAAPVGGVSSAPLGEIAEKLASYIDVYSNPLVLQAQSNLAAARATVATSRGKRRMDAIRRQTADYEDAVASAQAAANNRATDSAHRAIVLGLIGVIGTTVLILLLTGLAAAYIVKPLRRFTAAAGRIRAGDLDTRLSERAPGEVGALATSLNAMAATLRSNREERASRTAESEAQQAKLERAVSDLAAERDRAKHYHAFIDHLSAQRGKLQPLAQAMLGDLCRIADAGAASLYIVDERGGTDRLWLASTLGVAADSMPSLMEPGEGLVGRAALAQEPVSASRAEASLVVSGLGGSTTVLNEIHLPLVHGDRVLGVVSLGRPGGERFAAGEVAELVSMSRSAAVALSNALSLRTVEDAAELNRSVLESAQEAYMALDGDGVVRVWNSAASALFGYEEEEAVGALLADLIIPPEDRAGHHARRARIIEEAGQGARLDSYSVWVRDKAGKPLLTEISASTVRRGAGWQVSYFCRDVTERSLRDKQLRAEEAVSRTLAETDAQNDLIGPIMIALGQSFEWPLGCYWEYDERSRELRAARIWNGAEGDGAQLEQATREVTYSLDEPAPAAATPQLAWESGAPQWASLDQPGPGSKRLAAARAAGLRSVLALPVHGTDRVLGVLEFGIASADRPDETMLRTLRSIGDLVGQVIERRRAEEDADRLKSEFFALVSHELRTPLTSVIGYLDIVREDEEGGLSEEQDRFLSIIDRNARRLLRLVGDLLFVAQVEAGTLSLEKGRVDLEQVALDAVEAARPRAGKLGVALDADTVPIFLEEGDFDRLGQLVDNLISNALKFTPEGGSVTVRLRLDDGTAVLEVSDTGMGISAADQEHLFERFYRAQQATEKAIPGIGLGLSICAAIAAGSGGAITVESTEGHGTTFRVTLPLAAVEATDPVLGETLAGGSR
jgi:PAS domain S-box-containing protein